MSIIHDALKKIQQDKTQGSATTPEQGNSTGPVPAGQAYTMPNVARPDALKIAPDIPRNWALALMGVITLIVLALVVILFQLAQRSLYTPPPAKVAQALDLPMSKTAGTVKTVDPEEQHLFNIEGIMTDGDKMIALINGDVYEEGDVIEQMIILEIAPEGVTLIKNGHVRTIPFEK